MKTTVIATFLVLCFTTFLFAAVIPDAMQQGSETDSRWLMQKLETAALSSHRICDQGRISAKTYSATSYIIFIVADETTGGMLYLFSDTHEALAGTAVPRRYFRSSGNFDATDINEKEWIQRLIEMSPNLHKYIFTQQKIAKNEKEDPRFKNDCKMKDIHE